MASKSKRARLAEQQKKKSVAPVLIWSLVAALVGYLQNRYGQFSDIRGFYGMRFMDGLHHWPYDSYTPAGATSPLNPIEYPAITGVIVWLLTFFVPKSGNPVFNYFAINAFVNAILFLGTTYFIRKMSDNKSTYLYIFAPAVVMALNLNWDLWAMLPMLAAIYYFDKKKYELSAVLLGVSIAAKFFPIVLLLPICIFFLRVREIRLFAKYLGFSSVSWLILNLPVLLTSFEGWKYFYTFSFSRGLGDGSIFSIFSKAGLDIKFTGNIYYALNILIFGLLMLYLFRKKENLPLSYSAFLTLVAFTYFGKQFSMQYILWLTPLAVIAGYSINRKLSRKFGVLFVIWQLSEWAFRYAYFQNLLTNIYQGDKTVKFQAISDYTYGIVGINRYLCVAVFVGYSVYLTRKKENTNV